MSGSDLGNGRTIWRTWETPLGKATEILFPKAGVEKIVHRGADVTAGLPGVGEKTGWGIQHSNPGGKPHGEGQAPKGAGTQSSPGCRTQEEIDRDANTCVGKAGDFSGDRRKHSRLSLAIPAQEARAGPEVQGPSTSSVSHSPTIR